MAVDSRQQRRRRQRKPISAISAAMLAVWQRPEYRAKQSAHFVERRADPLKRWSRSGIPDGYTRETAQTMWAEARAKAVKTLEALKRRGFF